MSNRIHFKKISIALFWLCLCSLYATAQQVRLKSVFPLIGSGGMEVKWDPVLNAQEYEIRRKADAGAYGAWQSKGTSTTHNESGLSAASMYTYQVRAKVAGTWGPASNEKKNGFGRVWPVRRASDCTTESIELLHGFGQPIEAGGSKYFHEGVDINGESLVDRECVKAPVGGIILSHGGSGYNISVNLQVSLNGNTRYIQLNHLQNLNANLVDGESVAPGDSLGYIMSGGWNTLTSHTHCHFWSNYGNLFGTTINPFNIWSSNAYRDPQGNAPEVMDTNGDNEKMRFRKAASTTDYFPKDSKLYTGVDVIVEAVDKQSSDEPWQVPKEVGYFIERKQNNAWVSAVKSAAAPYLLMNTNIYYQSNSSTANSAVVETIIDYTNSAKSVSPHTPSAYQFSQWFTYIVTNTKGTDGTIPNLDKDQCWATDARQTVGSDNGYVANYDKARAIDEAKFPDGKYQINIQLADFVNKPPAYKQEVEVDNFRPYVKKVEMNAGKLAYSATWNWNAGGGQLVLADNTNTEKACGAVKIKITTSEPMKDVSVEVSSLSFNKSSSTAVSGSDSKEWEFEIPEDVIKKAKEGPHKLLIDGHDLADNTVFGFTSKGSVSALARRKPDGTWDPAAANKDNIHEFKVLSLTDKIQVAPTPVTACDKSDGKATVTVAGESGDFEYAVDNGAFQASNQFENLASGKHRAKVRPKGGDCEFTKDFTIDSNSKLKLSISGTGTKQFCENTSPPTVTLRATASGGSGQYEYSWPGGTKTVSAGGWYSVSVKDLKTGCTTSMGGEVIFVPIVCSRDPNDIVGPEGYGPGKMVSKFQAQPYKIRFENDPKFATAPAQIVKITHPLDENVNIFSFRLGSFGFGPFAFQVPENKTFYSSRLNVVDSLGVVVDVTAGIDVTKREAFWIFESKDPVTGLAPGNAILGFLPVNDSTAIGEGYVTYTIKPGNGTATGDTIYAQASIVFDQNAPLETPEIFNTVDAAAPSSRVQPLTPGENTNVVHVSWSGQDDANGAGVRSYTLYVSEDDGPYTVYRSGITETSASFTGRFGSNYRFYTRALDNVGNQEAAKQNPESSVVLRGRTLAVTGLANQALCENGAAGPLAFAVMDGETAVTGATVSVSSSDTTLVSSADVVLAGSGNGRTLTVTPAPGRTGTATLTVKAVTADGGNGEASFVLTVHPAPHLGVTHPTAVCAPGAVDLTTTFADAANVPGVVTYWQDSLATVALSDPQAVRTSGTYYLRKTAAAGGCTDTRPVVVTINPVPVAEAGPARTVPVDEPAFALDGFSPADGAWSGTGVEANGTFNPAAAGMGTFVLTYTVTRNGCTGTDTLTVAVERATTAPTIAGFTPTSGYAGTLVSISGTNLTYTSEVSFGGTNATDFTVVNDSLITATVPGGPATGKITLFTPVGMAVSAGEFTQRNRTTPIVTWATPGAISYGTALSGAQLNATASLNGNPVAGTFSYDPAAGTVLNAGVHPLHVTFTPDNQADYTPATASVDLTVNPATPVIAWPNPAPVAEGTLLSAVQLNATASLNGSPVAGTFAYTPAAGTVLTAGRVTLTADFAPADTLNYRGVTGTAVLLSVNGAPVLAAPGDRTVNAGETLAFTAAATDADGLGQTLTYALVGDAYGATLNATTGAFAWTPTAAQGGASYSFALRVTDSGTPALADEETFTVTVTLAPPRITAFTPASGPVGTRVTLTGSNLAGVTVVRFNGVAATVLSATATQLVTTVPAGATTGPIVVSGPAGLATTATPFTVTVLPPPPAPTISDFTPPKGPVGTQVTLNGTNFTGATAVRFGTVAAATFRVVSAGTITATVPAGAVTAFLYVTTPGGTAVSKKQYQVTTPRARVAGAGKPAPEAFAVEYNPNPFAREFTLTVKGKPGENAAVVIYDAFGRVARKVSELPLNKKLTLGLDLPPAVYYLHVTHGNEVRVFKIVKLGL